MDEAELDVPPLRRLEQPAQRLLHRHRRRRLVLRGADGGGVIALDKHRAALKLLAVELHDSKDPEQLPSVDRPRLLDRAELQLHLGTLAVEPGELACAPVARVGTCDGGDGARPPVQIGAVAPSQHRRPPLEVAEEVRAQLDLAPRSARGGAGTATPLRRWRRHPHLPTSPVDLEALELRERTLHIRPPAGDDLRGEDHMAEKASQLDRLRLGRPPVESAPRQPVRDHPLQPLLPRLGQGDASAAREVADEEPEELDAPARPSRLVRRPLEAHLLADRLEDGAAIARCLLGVPHDQKVVHVRENVYAAARAAPPNHSRDGLGDGAEDARRVRPAKRQARAAHKHARDRVAQDKVIPRRAVDPHAPEPIAQVMLDEVGVRAEQPAHVPGRREGKRSRPRHSVEADVVRLTRSMFAAALVHDGPGMHAAHLVVLRERDGLEMAGQQSPVHLPAALRLGLEGGEGVLRDLVPAQLGLGRDADPLGHG